MSEGTWNPMAQQYEPKQLTLAEFLLARIAEDETEAEGHRGGAYFRWHFESDPDPGRIGGRVVGTSQHAEVANDWSSPYNPAGYIGVAPHIARWDPARVLAECEAKRRIVELHASKFSGTRYDHLPAECELCGPDTGRNLDEQWPCDTLRALALPYADHPDYRAEWRA